MKLQVPFVQFPLAFDAAKLLAEVSALGEEAWRPHPQGYRDNSALPLISVHGDPVSDEIAGPMRPTPHLQACPYLQQVLASLGAVWGRSRLMRLRGHAEVPAHTDLSYYWRERVRVHVPILTQPGVRFICGEAEVNMAAGECWIFDTWRKHRVINDAEGERIHLVADTVGGERFWELAGGGRVVPGLPIPGWQPRLLEVDRNARPGLICESVNLPIVMTPWELRDHLAFLIGEAVPHAQLAAVQELCVRLTVAWLALWARYGAAAEGWSGYRVALDAFAQPMQQVAQTIVLRNGSPFLMALKPLVLRTAVSEEATTAGSGNAGADPDAGAYQAESAMAPTPAAVHVVRRIDAAVAASSHLPQDQAGSDPRFDRPVFILSPPRSGSTLLFETLARAPNLYTVGGENHERVEGIAELHPAARGYDSNRLGVDAATAQVATMLRQRFSEALRNREGEAAAGGRLRMLEKTPKNVLRIPFLRQVFPEARFVYLYRDPREVLGSMIDAWMSGRFRTYPDLPGWTGPDWSLVLVPGWRALAGRPLPEIVARQWETATRILLDDLDEVPAERVIRIRYDALLADPQATIQRLCARLDLAWDIELGAALPRARYTVSAPAPDKWRRHQREIDSVLASIAATGERAEQAAVDPSER